MTYPNIPYQSFCWVIGTTSFRTAQLNLKIEQQLILLNELQQNQTDWQWDKEQQAKYYALMKERNLLKGNAQWSDKDARAKTSGLKNIGLIDENCTLTEIGQKLLQISQNQQFTPDNPLNLAADSFIYFKQLLKTTLREKKLAWTVRPYLVLAYLLNELDYLTEQEFTYLLPLCIHFEQLNQVIDLVKQNRIQSNLYSIEDVIYRTLLGLKNYTEAQTLFLQPENQVDEELICVIGINHKSRKPDGARYDKPYFALYQQILQVFLHNQLDVSKLYESVQAVTQGTRTKWKSLLFGNNHKGQIQKLGKDALHPNNPFSGCLNEQQIREQFFKYLHVFKAMATLEDYQDLNKRYFALSDTLIFADEQVRFDILPKYYFADCFEYTGLSTELFQDFKTEQTKLGDDFNLDDISPCLQFHHKRIFAQINADFGENIQYIEQVNQFVHHERQTRFHELLNHQFGSDTLLKLLDDFKSRNDKEIAQCVTDDAEIPTIFEYVLGIIWYEISGRQGNILDYMKLSLDVNLLPKSHAAGGDADIVYRYPSSLNYPEHTMLLEATLTTSSNQRRMEMEPVSRHLGEQRLKSGCADDYCVFISTYLHPNVVADFRVRRLPESYYYGSDGKVIQGMKIIPLSTDDLKKIIENKVNYADLYTIFEQHYAQTIEPKIWSQQLSELLERQ